MDKWNAAFFGYLTKFWQRSRSIIFISFSLSITWSHLEKTLNYLILFHFQYIIKMVFHLFFRLHTVAV